MVFVLELLSGLPADLEGNVGKVWDGDSVAEGGDEGEEGEEEEEDGTA